MSTETETETSDENDFTELILRAPTFEISVFAALAILGLVAYVTAHMGMTPEQAAVWREHGSFGVGVYEYAVRPSYWRLQARAGELLFMFAAFAEGAHHLAERLSRKET